MLLTDVNEVEDFKIYKALWHISHMQDTSFEEHLKWERKTVYKGLPYGFIRFLIKYLPLYNREEIYFLVEKWSLGLRPSDLIISVSKELPIIKSGECILYKNGYLVRFELEDNKKINCFCSFSNKGSFYYINGTSLWEEKVKVFEAQETK